MRHATGARILRLLFLMLRHITVAGHARHIGHAFMHAHGRCNGHCSSGIADRTIRQRRHSTVEQPGNHHCQDGKETHEEEPSCATREGKRKLHCRNTGRRSRQQFDFSQDFDWRKAQTIHSIEAECEPSFLCRRPCQCLFRRACGDLHRDGAMRLPAIRAGMLMTKGRIDLVVNSAVYPPQNPIVRRTCPEHQHLVWKMANP